MVATIKVRLDEFEFKWGPSAGPNTKHLPMIDWSEWYTATVGPVGAFWDLDVKVPSGVTIHGDLFAVIPVNLNEVEDSSVYDLEAWYRHERKRQWRRHTRQNLLQYIRDYARGWWWDHVAS